MKKLLPVLLFIFSSCEIDPKQPLFPEYVERAEDFYVSTRLTDSELTLSWICKLMSEETNISWKEGGKKISDLKFILQYDSEAPAYSYLEPSFSGSVTTVDDVKSPCFINGLESGKTYYFFLTAVIGADRMAASTVFKVEIP